MPIPTNINTLINGNVVETARIEFKESWNAAASLKTICAFANDIDNWGGGYILIGVEEESGRPKMPIASLELSEIDKIQKELLAKCKLIQPSYTPKFTEWTCSFRFSKLKAEEIASADSNLEFWPKWAFVLLYT